MVNLMVNEDVNNKCWRKKSKYVEQATGKEIEIVLNEIHSSTNPPRRSIATTFVTNSLVTEQVEGKEDVRKVDLLILFEELNTYEKVYGKTNDIDTTPQKPTITSKEEAYNKMPTLKRD